jgi:putative transposase
MPAIFNTDCGSQYTSKEFIAMLEGYGIRISMDGIGRCLDNIFVERTWRTLKYECIFLHDYNTMTQLSNGLDAFIAFFNDERLHQGLDYQTPNEVYEQGCFPIREKDIQVA